MAKTPEPHEHVLEAIRMSPDQFTDCAQAIIHTILFNRLIDSTNVPHTFRLPGVDIMYVTAEPLESQQQILSRLSPLQSIVFTGITKTWLVVTLSTFVPKHGWFRDSYANEVWERWCIPFTFATLTARDLRQSMLTAIEKITEQAAATEMMPLTEGGTFHYVINLPTDKDWETSKECIRLVQKIAYPRA
jgi:hypothetical protein